MPKKNILFLRGIRDNRQVSVISIRNGSRFDLSTEGSANIYKYLKNERFDQTEITLDTNKQQNIKLHNIHAIFNQISDADTHSITLSKAENLQKKVSKQIPFFNSPSNIKKTRRDIIYTLLQGIEKLQVPKTVKIQPCSPSEIHDVIKKENFTYPVIFRQAGDHGGISTIKVEDESEQFFAFALDGRDYYLTQFVETIKDDIYTKYRLAIVDGEIFLRHVMFSEEWMVHNKSQLEDLGPRIAVSNRFNKEVKPNIQHTINEIHSRLGLDYFGIDCHIDDDMNLIIFEINANMNMFAKVNESVFKEHVMQMRQALIKMLTT